MNSPERTARTVVRPSHFGREAVEEKLGSPMIFLSRGSFPLISGKDRSPFPAFVLFSCPITTQRHRIERCFQKIVQSDRTGTHGRYVRQIEVDQKTKKKRADTQCAGP
jgi:hypothetical protein